MKKQKNRYSQIIEKIFLMNYEEGTERIAFRREDILRAARELRISLPKNVGDVIYSFRYRASLPDSIRRMAPPGKEWIIEPAGRSVYGFVAASFSIVSPAENLVETKLPDATLGIIALYALTDEQAILAKLRYNRLIDIFTGVTSYSLQSHLRTSVEEMGQIETDEIYVGIDKRGMHYVFPVQAKGHTDSIHVVQIQQDIAMCREKFPDLICRPIAAQFITAELIALFEFEEQSNEIRVSSEKHYRLVDPAEFSSEDLELYRQRTLD